MTEEKDLRQPESDRQRVKILLITGLRIVFFIAILAITILFQLRQSLFFNTDSLFPIYILLINAFILNAIYLLFFEKTQKFWQPTAFLFGFDTIFITALIFITGVQQSIFLFMYLVNIILCGLVFQRRGAFLLALFTSACFSVLLIFGPSLNGQTLYFAMGLNNLAFFAVAGLSGYLSEQLNFMGAELTVKSRDLKILQDLNKVIVDNIQAGLITLSADLEIISANSAAYKILHSHSLVRNHIETVFPGVEAQIDPHFTVDKRFERRHRGLILGMSLSPIPTATHGAAGYILIFQDLTDIKKMEMAMRRQEKLAAIGKLAAGIAHEIRNPLASISGSIELLSTLIEAKTTDQIKLVDIMTKEIKRLNGLITEFLDFVRPEERKMDLCDIDSLLNEVLDMVKLNKSLVQSVGQSRHISSRAYVVGDKNKLKQVFLNLVINAYQAMGEVGNRDDLTLTVDSSVQGEWLWVRIRDNGPGMSDQTQRRLFEPFFTTKPKGTGLGLATCHKILETHDARIFVESHEGQGTEFAIQFQIATTQQGATIESQNTGS